MGIVIVIVFLAAGLSLLGYTLLKDSQRFADFVVVLKNRSRWKPSPSQEPAVPSTAVATDNGNPSENSSGHSSTPVEGGRSSWHDITNLDLPGEGGTPSGTAEPAPDRDPGSYSGGNGQTEPARVRTRSEVLSYCDGELEKMWEYYTACVEEMEQEARGEYRALPAEERTKEKKEEIVASKTDQLYALEDECDARVNELLTYVAAELRKLGEDTGVISDYRKEYGDRKHAMESDYIQRFQKSVA